MSVSPENLPQQFESRGLGAYWPTVRALLKPCLHLRYAPAPDEQIGRGASKLGGRPDLPRPLAWPAFGQSPLAFVAQLNLADVPDSEVRRLLPPAGLLSFFGSAAPDDGALPHAVHWTNATATELERRAPPPGWPPAELGYPAGRVTAVEPRPSLPSGESDAIAALFLGADPALATPAQYANRAAYWRLAEPDTPGEQANQLFGHPAHDDGRLELICECIASGDPDLQQLPGFSAAQRAALRRKWLLLLQVASNPDLDLYFGADLDYLYFWIAREDLARRDFSRTVAFSLH